MSLLIAPDCAACGLPLEHASKGTVCPACWQSIVPVTAPVCDMCGDPLPSWRAVSLPAGRCPRCRRSPRVISRARAIGLYDGSLRSIVHAFKYEGRRSLARPLGVMMRAGGDAVLQGADFAVPVPLHFWRRQERGFNQAVDLAAHIGLPWIGALKKVRATAVQASLPASRRHANVRDAFAARRQALVLRDAIVVLIDDVCTTGATLEACARVLKAAGVREVRALTAARVATSRR